MIRTFKKVLTIVLFIIILLVHPPLVGATSDGATNLVKAEKYIDQSLVLAKKGDLSESDNKYKQFRNKWLTIEDSVKAVSKMSYQDIESKMGQVEYAFIQNKKAAIVSGLNDLSKVNHSFINGNYSKSDSVIKQDISLNDFIDLLNVTKSKAESHDQVAALKEMKKVRESWLSVEGKVVSQSSKRYNQSERDMVVANAMIQNKDYQHASKTLANMVHYLYPLAQEQGYSIWDASMIPLREGFEALLVVGALLTFVKKTNEGRGRGWIWSGVSIGIILSAVLALIVKVVFNSGAFGNNNFLIAGITGLFASVMLLYMSYWLHSKSNISEWNRYIKSKSQAALTSGSLISLGFLSFLAVFREGTETVLFVIGMANQISLHKLVLGLVVGLGVLVFLSLIMFVIGMKLPIRPFFIVSSLIVFYLCLKFTGLGIHSLQLAGIIPSTYSTELPSSSALALFPTWESTIPQLAILVFALAVFIWKKRSRQNK